MTWWRALSGRSRKVGPLIAQADQARDRADWCRATDLYGQVLAQRPHLTAIRIQRGHAWKILGRLDDAIADYRQAVAELPGDADANLQLGHALKLSGDRPAAVAAFVAALRIDPLHTTFREIVALGARDAIPDDIQRDLRRQHRRDLADRIDRLGVAIEDARTFGAYATGGYDAFRRDFPVPPPTAAIDDATVTIVIDAMATVPALLRRTLLSLIAQSHVRWTAHVVAPQSTIDHSVGGFALQDDRIRFVADLPDGLLRGVFAMSLDGGTVLDPSALAWLLTAHRAGAAGVYADHDSGVEDWRGETICSAPACYWTHDPDFLDETIAPPALATLATVEADAGRLATAWSATGGVGLRRAMIGRSAGVADIRHVPATLATVLDLPDAALCGVAPPLPPIGALPPVDADAVSPLPIRVVIPTRDEPDMLDRCIRSLIDRAARPDALRIVILDNRSTADATRRYLAEGARVGRFTVISFDEPFNWSRASNIGAVDGDEPILLFANNDVVMLTEGWDTVLRRDLARAHVGAVGARLLYPDGSVQHAGILLGMGEGLPLHDGLHASGDDPGPLGRWVTAHRAAAVTGAFLATTRRLFDDIGGFDEARLFVAYNDVDFCLRVRERDLAVLYQPAIELIHHESKTRGYDTTQAQIAWDHGERGTLLRRWGRTLAEDPSCSPRWSRRGPPFQALQPLSRQAVLDRLAAPGGGSPWRAVRAGPVDPDQPAGQRPIEV